MPSQYLQESFKRLKQLKWLKRLKPAQAKPSIPNLGVNNTPQHALLYSTNRWIRSIIGMVVTAVLVFPCTIAAAVWIDFNNTISDIKVDVIPSNGKKHKTSIIDPYANQPIQILLLGQDTRDGDGNASIGGSSASLKGNHQADTSMILQISADRSFINLISIPRDSLVDVPECAVTGGTIPAQSGVMFNSIFAQAYAQGGDLSSAASCTLNAVNALTGMDIQNFVVVDFNGLKSMIDAIGGVDICIPTDLTDSKTHLNLTKGMHHLDGASATQYARMRHGTGTDGSDIMRTTRQQYLVKQLMKEALNKNLFTQSSQLYQLAKTALQSLNISSGLASATTLVGLAMSLKDLDLDNLFTQTVPVTTAPSDPNRVVWTDKASTLWEKMRNDQPLGTKKTVEKKTKSSGKSSKKNADAKKNDVDDTASGDASSNSGSATGQSQTGTSENQVDAKTGLITDAAGQLIDPNTGGIVDPETGTIKDPETGQYLGIAQKYLNATVCAVN